MRCFLWFVVAVLLHSSKAAVFTTEQESQIRDFISAVMRCKEIPGMNLAVVKGNETWTQGFGVADMDADEEVTESMLFGIGSLSKAFTMVRLGMALKEHGLGWNTNLTDVPGFNYEFVDSNRTRETTIVDLLAHRTGLSNMLDDGSIAGYPDGVTRNLLAQRLKYLPGTNDFRSVFKYNNFMYTILGHVTEVLSGGTWEELVTAGVFEPLGMESTKVLQQSDDVLAENTAKPYVSKNDELVPGTKGIYRIYPLEPAGSVLSNAVDMAKWIKFNLNLGRTEDGRILLDEELFSDAFNVHIEFQFNIDLRVPVYPINDIYTGYGLAWFISNYRNYTRYWHSGGIFSYVSRIWLYPDQHLGIYANINGPAIKREPGLGLNAILYFISDLLLDLDPWLTPETACTFPSPWMNSTERSSPELEDTSSFEHAQYTGRYGCEILPEITVSPGEANTLGFSWGRLGGLLHPTEINDTFKMEFKEHDEYVWDKRINENATAMYDVIFYRSENGEIEGFDLKYDGTIKMIKDFDFFGDDSSSGVPVYSVNTFLTLLVVLLATTVYVAM